MVEELVKVYDGVRAVDGISFRVREGEVFAFLGPNGAGKTTVVEVLQCLRTPTSGKATVMGLDVARRDEAKKIKKITGVMPQEFRGVDRLTVMENVKLFAEIYGRSGDVRGLLERMGLWEFRNRLFEKLSGGLKQRVGLASALVNDPEILFLDEPTTGLDPTARREVWGILEDLRREGKTILLTTHYMEEAEALADYIAIINRGKIIAEGNPRELINRYGGRKKIILRRFQGVEEKLEAAGVDYRRENELVIAYFNTFKDVARLFESLGEALEHAEPVVRSPGMEEVFLSLLGARITEEGVLA